MSELRKTTWKLHFGKPGTNVHRHYYFWIHSREECGVTTAIAPAFPGVVKTANDWDAEKAVCDEVFKRIKADDRLKEQLTPDTSRCRCAEFQTLFGQK